MIKKNLIIIALILTSMFLFVSCKGRLKNSSPIVDVNKIGETVTENMVVESLQQESILEESDNHESDSEKVKSEEVYAKVETLDDADNGSLVIVVSPEENEKIDNANDKSNDKTNDKNPEKEEDNNTIGELADVIMY